MKVLSNKEKGNSEHTKIVILKLYFEISLYLQKSCKYSAEGASIPFTEASLDVSI